jgi:hypothetical protein
MKNMLLELPLRLEATTSKGNHRVEHFSSHVMKFHDLQITVQRLLGKSPLQQTEKSSAIAKKD